MVFRVFIQKMTGLIRGGASIRLNTLLPRVKINIGLLVTMLIAEECLRIGKKRTGERNRMFNTFNGRHRLVVSPRQSLWRNGIGMSSAVKFDNAEQNECLAV